MYREDVGFHVTADSSSALHPESALCRLTVSDVNSSSPRTDFNVGKSRKVIVDQTICLLHTSQLLQNIVSARKKSVVSKCLCQGSTSLCIIDGFVKRKKKTDFQTSFNYTSTIYVER